jgi:hypothetical protein
VVAATVTGWDTTELCDGCDLLIDQLTARTLDGSTGDRALHDSIAALQRLAARVEAEKLRRVAEVVARGSHLLEGARTTIDLLTRLGLTRGEAREQLDTAVALDDMPGPPSRSPRGSSACAKPPRSPSSARHSMTMPEPTATPRRS